ncbi:MAG: hypothetical protein A2W35_01695 [Chloroflexi bacterium RBG_16_57_11]|nr:MAG: hypothetical protein A2W35_01695 [Chloroflexi bacterium RBG_16_57_11]
MNKAKFSRTGYLVFAFLAGILLALVWPAWNSARGAPPGKSLLAPSGTGFTYQGRLVDNGSPANGSYDIQFLLFDSEAAGAQIGPIVTHNDVAINQGFFSVELDFGTGAFGGGGRWLQIAVRPGSSTGAYTLLSPRQKLSPAPSALSLPNVYTDEGVNFVGIGRNFRVSGNEVFGIRYTGSANQYGGMYVETSDAGGWPFYGYATNGSFRAWTYYNGTNGEWSLYNAGIRLKVPSTGGLRIGPSLNYSLVISNTTGSDGIRILDTGDDAIQIGSNPDIPNYGVYIPSPGVSTYGLWSNTSNVDGEWALYTVDNIQAGNVLANAYSLVVRVTGVDSLSPGDLAAVSGVTEPIPGSSVPMPLVRLADATTYSGVIGVVKSRMVWEAGPGKEAEGEMSMHSADGPAQPGEYVSLIVFGIAQVKVDPTMQISPGERLTASNLAGMARPLMKQDVNGMLVVEGAPVIGIALSAPVADQDSIPVFVTLR